MDQKKSVLGQLKIAHVIYRLDFGGLENGLVNLVNLSPDCYQHTIITLAGVNDSFASRIVKPVEIIRVDKKPGHDMTLFWRLWKTLRAVKPDIVHTRNLATIEAQIPAYLAGVRYRVHGEHGWDISDPHGQVRKYQLLRRWVGILIHKFVPLSSQIESYLLTKVGIPSRKICKICNGVDIQRFQALQKEEPVTDTDDKGRFVLMCVGRLEEIKGHTDLIAALSLLKGKIPALAARLTLTIVGDGSQRKALETQVKHHHLGDIVSFLGSRSDIPDLLQMADCFVLPSLAEGISNTILEAMASALPVIATDVGGNSDLLVHKVTGYLVPAQSPDRLADAIASYLQQPARCRHQGRTGRLRVFSEFTLERMVEKYCALYEQRANESTSTRQFTSKKTTSG